MNNPLSFPANILKDDIICHKENIVLCVARLSEKEKRVSYMLYIWKGIESDKRFDDWRFDIVGDGPSYDDYKNLAINFLFSYYILEYIIYFHSLLNIYILKILSLELKVDQNLFLNYILL